MPGGAQHAPCHAQICPRAFAVRIECDGALAGQLVKRICLHPFSALICSLMADNVFEAAAAFFCERRGFNRDAALSPTGPITALLAGVRSHVQQPRQLLLGRLAGLLPSGGSGSSRSLQHPAAWQFFVRLLCCLRVLQGTGWDPLVKVGRGWLRPRGAPRPSRICSLCSLLRRAVLPTRLAALANLSRAGMDR